jgi:hypothetical protein
LKRAQELKVGELENPALSSDETALAESLNLNESLPVYSTWSSSPQLQSGILTPNETPEGSIIERNGHIQVDEKNSEQSSGEQPFELTTYSSAEAWMATFRS